VKEKTKFIFILLCFVIIGFSNNVLAAESDGKDQRTVAQVITKNEGGRIYNLVAANDKIYYLKGVNYYPTPFNSRAELSLIEYNPISSQKKILKRMKSTSATSMQVVGNKIYYSLVELDRESKNLSRDTLNVLYSYDLITAKNIEIFRDNFKDFVVLDTGEVIYTKNNKEEFGSQLWRYSSKGKEKLNISDKFIKEITIYHDKFIVVSKNETGSWNINYLNLAKDKVALKPIIDTSYTEKFIKIVDNSIYFSADYDGNYSGYSYNLITKELSQLAKNHPSIEGIPYQDKYYFVSLNQQGQTLYKEKLDMMPITIAIEKKRLTSENTADDYKVKNRKDQLGLFKPLIKFPIFIGGNIFTGNYYVIKYLGDFSVNFESKLSNSLYLGISSFEDEDDDKITTEVSLNSPLYLSKLSGLSVVKLGYSTDFNEKFNPNLAASFSYPRQDIVVSEEVNLKEESSTNTKLLYRYIFDNSSIVLQSKRYYNFENEEGSRTFSSAEADNGYQLNLDYIHKLKEVRNNLWSPNYFLKDIYGSIFMDYSKDLNEGNYDFSGGYELLFEFKFAKYIPVVPRLGITSNGEDFKGYFGIQGDF